MVKMKVKAHWKKAFANPATTFTLLAILLAIPRFIWLLSGQYNNIIVIFLVMWVLPFILLTKSGRTAVGIRKPQNYPSIFYSFLLGLLSAYLIYLLGAYLFQKSENNWYITIMNSFNKNDLISDIKPSLGLFFLVSFPTMIFSPIGEEFFFRGMLHEAFAEKWGERKATLADASFFGLTHVAHHGLLFGASGIKILPSSIPWVLLMMMVSVLFSFMRKKSGSIWGAVGCHAGFNLGMMGSIVYLLHE